MMEQLASIDESKNKVELLGRLERELQWNDERIVDLGEHGSLGQGVSDLRSRDNVCFSYSLEGVDTSGIVLSEQNSQP